MKAPRPQLNWNRSRRQNRHNDRPFQGDPLCGARTVPIHGDPKFATRTYQDYKAPPTKCDRYEDSEDDYRAPCPADAALRHEKTLAAIGVALSDDPRLVGK